MSGSLDGRKRMIESYAHKEGSIQKGSKRFKVGSDTIDRKDRVVDVATKTESNRPKKLRFLRTAVEKEGFTEVEEVGRTVGSAPSGTCEYHGDALCWSALEDQG